MPAAQVIQCSRVGGQKFIMKKDTEETVAITRYRQFSFYMRDTFLTNFAQIEHKIST
jgi:hypothetical protein